MRLDCVGNEAGVRPEKVFSCWSVWKRLHCGLIWRRMVAVEVHSKESSVCCTMVAALFASCFRANEVLKKVSDPKEVLDVTKSRINASH